MSLGKPRLYCGAISVGGGHSIRTRVVILYFFSSSLERLERSGRSGEAAPFPYWLRQCLNYQPMFKHNMGYHVPFLKRVELVKKDVPTSRSVAKRVHKINFSTSSYHLVPFLFRNSSRASRSISLDMNFSANLIAFFFRLDSSAKLIT